MRRVIFALLGALLALSPLHAYPRFFIGGMNGNDGASGSYVNAGTGTSVADIWVGTVFAWARRDSTGATARDLLNKTVANGGLEWHQRAADGTSMRFALQRATTATSLISPTGMIVAGKIQFWAVTWDKDTSASDVMYRGDLDTPARDVVATVVGGTGTPSTDAAEALSLLGDNTASQGWGGTVWVLGLGNQVLSLAEIQALQFNPRSFRGCVGLWRFGVWGSGRIVDECRGANPGVQTGTLTRVNAILPRVTFARPRL